ncbi:MAG: Spi family protease inhibitor [Lentimicrobiaceae bacterium]|nr:Spi family protease inhibitor [Lentimicrobiaceae bacterium]
MRKILIVCVLAAWGLPIWCKPIDENTARKVAGEVLMRSAEKQKDADATQWKGEDLQPLKLVYKSSSKTMEGRRESADAEIVYFYVFVTADNSGFVIVSGDDRAAPVLGYSLSNGFSVENMPENAAWWLGEYAKQIAYAIENNLEQTQEVRQQWERYLKEVDNNEKIGGK